MSTYKVSGKDVIYAFSPGMKPVLEVEDGAVVVFESNDCFTQQVKSNDDVLNEIDHELLNPATGPVFVKGAGAGDLLKVDILGIDVEDRGVAAVVPGEGLLPDDAKEAIVRTIPIKDGAAEYLGLRLPIRPMIGVIGVAPRAQDGECSTDTPWKHGGNMDTHDIRKGRTLYFPVAEDGALFALGDCHALMGDGEVCFTGLEVPATVTVRLSVIKGKAGEWPILETEDETMILGSGRDLEDALQNSLRPAVKSLAKVFNVMWEEAYILASLVVDLRISQVVDPMKTVRAVIPKSVLTTEELIDTFS
jgi:amidase